MRLLTLSFAAAVTLTSALALSPAASAAECFDSGTNFACSVTLESDGSFTVTSPERSETIFLVDEAGLAERIDYDPVEARGFRAGYYRRMTDTDGCWQDTQLEDQIFCAWP